MARFACLVALLAIVAGVQGYHHNLKQQNVTDLCLWNIVQGTQLIPKIVDDIQKMDILNLMTDILQFVPLINGTKGNCSEFDFLDIANRTTINLTMDCYHGFQNVGAVFGILVDDVTKGDMGAIFRDITWLLGNFSITSATCDKALQTLQDPHNLANFWNSSACWAVHERSADILMAVLDAYKRGNWTEIIPLVLPLIGTSAETFRQCSIWPKNHSQNYNYNFSYPEFIMFEHSRGDAGQCIADITDVVKTINVIVDDINSGNWMKLYQDAMAAVPLIQKTIADCLSFRPDIHTIMPYLNQTIIRNVKFCISDVMHLKEEAFDILKRALKNGPESVVFEVMGLVGNSKRIFNGCTNNGQFFSWKTVINYYPGRLCEEAQHHAGQSVAQLIIAYRHDKLRAVAILPEVTQAVKNVMDICHRDPSF